MKEDYTVPILVQDMLGDRVIAFNKKMGWKERYFSDARGKFIYLAKILDDRYFQRLGRLTYLGDPENMEFVLLNQKSGKYDPNEKSFPGSQHLNGTIEGALQALHEFESRPKWSPRTSDREKEFKTMIQYKYLTGPDDVHFCQRVTEALNNGWQLYGHPTLTYDTKKESVICGQVIIKKVSKIDSSMLGEE